MSIDKQDEFEEETKEATKDLDALSDLSLSEEEFDKDSKDWVVLDDTNDEEKQGKKEEKSKEEKCTKCDIPHEAGRRCTFLLKSSSSSSGHHRSQHKYQSPAPRHASRVRTLPPELYNNPMDTVSDRHGGYRRSRSPPLAPPRRVAPPPPSPPGYEDRRDKRARYDDDHYDRERKSCKLCGNNSHLVKNCPDLFCFKCQNQGHFAKECAEAASNNQRSYNSHITTSIPQMYPGQPPMFPGQAQVTTMYQVTDHLPSNYTESLHSLQPLQVYMSAKMMAMPGQPYPKNYVDLLISNVGKMLAQANLGIR